MQTFRQLFLILTVLYRFSSRLEAASSLVAQIVVHTVGTAFPMWSRAERLGGVEYLLQHLFKPLVKLLLEIGSPYHLIPV